MMTKAIFGLAALFGLAGVGLSLADTRAGCCSPGAGCCFPGSPCCAPAATGAGVTPPLPVKADAAATSTIAVDGMSCAGCAKTVGKAVAAVEGVESAVADVKTKSLTVVAKTGATPSPRALWEAVEKAGYTPTRIAGAAGTFEEKPAR